MELKYSKEIINKEDYYKMWEKDNRPVTIYFHNPFCITEENCAYCMHKGCPKSQHDEGEVAQFYFQYMETLFDFYEPIVNSKDIKLINFGGGTPNYLDAKDFDTFLGNLFYKFPKLLDVPKIIEIHPALITKEFILMLRGFFFSTVIFCFQTFDNDILRENGRLISNRENCVSAIKLAKELGMNVGIDLITYWHTGLDWTDTLESDLKVVKQLEPDELTISVLYQNKYNNPNFNGDYVYGKIRQAVNYHLPDYRNYENTLEEHHEVAATRFFLKGSEKAKEEFDIYTHSLSDMPWQSEQGYSTLGMGTYKNGDKAAYSIIGQEGLVYEEFVDFDKPPILHLHKKWDFWEAAKNVIEAMREQFNGENPPVGATLTLQNIAEALNLEEEQFQQVFVGNCNWCFEPRKSWSGKSDYETKIDNEFEEKVERLDKKKIREFNKKEKIDEF